MEEDYNLSMGNISQYWLFYGFFIFYVQKREKKNLKIRLIREN